MCFGAGGPPKKTNSMIVKKIQPGHLLLKPVKNPSESFLALAATRRDTALRLCQVVKVADFDLTGEHPWKKGNLVFMNNLSNQQLPIKDQELYVVHHMRITAGVELEEGETIEEA
jgi:hypothetical protein